MATNKYPWSRNIGGAAEPLRVLLGVAAGSSATIKRGEICTVSGETASSATAGDGSLVVCDEEQKAADAACTRWFVVPRPDDVFEFPLDTARAVKNGETFAIGSDSQHLEYATSNVCARAFANSNMPSPEEDSTTRRTVGNVRVLFDELISYWSVLVGYS